MGQETFGTLIVESAERRIQIENFADLPVVVQYSLNGMS